MANKKNKKEERLLLREEITDQFFDPYHGEISVKDLTESLKPENIREIYKNHSKHINDYHDFAIDVDIEYGYYDDTHVLVKLIGYRHESDEEYESRLEKNAKQRERLKRYRKEKLERERKEYERLKKKFEKVKS